MKKIITIKKFVIYELNAKEQKQYDFAYAPILREKIECSGSVDPKDSDIECQTLKAAMCWALHC